MRLLNTVTDLWNSAAYSGASEAFDGLIFVSQFNTPHAGEKAHIVVMGEISPSPLSLPLVPSRQLHKFRVPINSFKQFPRQGESP